MEERYHHVMQPHHRLRPDQPAVYCLASRDIDPSGVRTRNPEPPDPKSERVCERREEREKEREREIGTRWVSAAGGWQPTLVLIQHDSDTASVPSDGTQVN